MLDIKDFNFLENHNNFDFKGFLIKVTGYWKWFIFFILFCMFIAYQVNVRKQKIYALETTIGINEEDNPLFTSNTSLVFNWGGTSDKVATIASTLKSRSHNEIVVEKLSYYIDYLQDRKYFEESVYGSCPFEVQIDKKLPQLANQPISIKFISPTQYQIRVDFELNTVNTYRYSDYSSSMVGVTEGVFSKSYKIGEYINLPFLSWKLVLKKNSENFVGQEYKVRFDDYNGVVQNYKNIKVDIDDKAPSILKLSLEGTNKARIVDYLNETVRVLIKNQLDKKNLFADNTINFIDTTLALMELKLRDANDDLKEFSKNKNVIEIEQGGFNVQNKMLELDLERDLIARKINYFNTLSNYLKNSKDYSKLPAPSVAGIDDPNIIMNVSNLIELSVRRSEMMYSVKSDVMLNNIDNEITSVKKVLLENIEAAKNAIQYSYNQVNNKINLAENDIRQMPDDKQELVKIMRKYNLSDNIYQTYLQKRSEASIVKAANLSDIQFIDSAKDIGGGLVGPKTGVNYVIALLLGFLLPLIIIIFIFAFNNSIQNSDDLARLTSIPLIGVVGVKKSKSYLAVFEKPKSVLSESFRAIRSSLQFLYKKQNLQGSKTLMLTSTVSGEGKTFCSINIATVFALSEKKTVIVGLDLRKPKIFDDFKLTNEVGAVNYLIGQKTLKEVTNATQIPYLDVITSGPIPPNPSELIMGDTMHEMMEELKAKYDYIILDTPPLGLVTDALELSIYADVTVYVMRQNITKKNMTGLLNNAVKRGELSNVSIILNGFENKAKYGASYGYDHGYGSYTEDNLDESFINTFFRKIKNRFKM
ncbi:MAG: polysaccharide biosynthesis tyrosine autokinase [Flavobacterium sp.]|uniref:exopolysaccharide transport family protein n=1 Tax=Flavobacterium sp. TaxID=239 RepID=UPI0022C9164E|nr:tyrosine-protein kinase [Flavobacterium sp.]MCZ8197327.1 polysaccharide biosynthesis tyrosine autokinase [Flavobacterium sp.]